MINETYSTFVQGFMPTQSRPDVDVLDGLTTAIIVGQERMGAEPPFDRRHVHRCQRDAAHALQPARRSAHRLTQRVLVQRAHRQGQWCDHHRARCQDEGREGDLLPARRHVPPMRGAGIRQRLRRHRALQRGSVPQRGSADDPGLHDGRLVRPHLPRQRLLRPGQADQGVHEEGAARPALQGADQDQGRWDQPHLRGPDPQDPEVDAVQGRRGPAAAHPGIRRAGNHVHHVPRLRGHAAHGRGALVEAQGHQHRRCLRHADQRPPAVGPRARRALGRPAHRRSPAPPRLLRGDRVGLPLPRPAVGHAVGWRVPADEDDPPPRLVAHRRHLRLRRAHDRPAPARHRAHERPAAAAAGQGQHRAGRRAQARGDRDRRPRRRPRPGRRHRGRRDRLRGHSRGPARQRHHHRPAPRRPRPAQGVAAHAHRHPARSAGRRPTTFATSTSTSRSASWSS